MFRVFLTDILSESLFCIKSNSICYKIERVEGLCQLTILNIIKYRIRPLFWGGVILTTTLYIKEGCGGFWGHWRGWCIIHTSGELLAIRGQDSELDNSGIWKYNRIMQALQIPARRMEDIPIKRGPQVRKECYIHASIIRAMKRTHETLDELFWVLAPDDFQGLMQWEKDYDKDTYVVRFIQ